MVKGVSCIFSELLQLQFDRDGIFHVESREFEVFGRREGHRLNDVKDDGGQIEQREEDAISAALDLRQGQVGDLRHQND